MFGITFVLEMMLSFVTRLFMCCLYPQKGMLEDDAEETGYYLLMFTLALSNIRATSFCIEKCWNSGNQSTLPDSNTESDNKGTGHMGYYF